MRGSIEELRFSLLGSSLYLCHDNVDVWGVIMMCDE